MSWRLAAIFGAYWRLCRNVASHALSCFLMPCDAFQTDYKLST
jgi:hypothetical protein